MKTLVVWTVLFSLKLVVAAIVDFEVTDNSEDPVDIERAYEESELNAKFDPITGKRRYDQYKLISVMPTSEEHLQALLFLEKGLVEIWGQLPKKNASSVDTVHMLIAPEYLSPVKKYLECSGMETNVMVDNLQDEIDNENKPVESVEEEDDLVGRPDSLSNYVHPLPYSHHLQRRGTFGDFLKSVFLPGGQPQEDSVRFGRHLNPKPVSQIIPNTLPGTSNVRGFCYTRSGMNWKHYHRLDAMDRYIDCLAADHSDKVQLIEIGRTSEDRPLRVLKLGRPSKALKPAVWIDGGIHAREWVSPAAVLFAVRELVENEADTSSSLLSFYDIYVLPVANPDGYEYSHETDRLWRKTRSTGSGGCRGVDPNRNWGYRWGGDGASTNPCHETFRGHKPFSEPETAAIKDFILSRSDTIKMYITFHSYGQYVLYPWGYAEIDAVDVNDLHSVGLTAAEAMERVSGRKYSVGSAAKLLYPAAGGSDDWAKGGAGIKYSYTIELPDRGHHGFILPAQYIESVGEEAYAAVDAMIRRI